MINKIPLNSEITRYIKPLKSKLCKTRTLVYVVNVYEICKITAFILFFLKYQISNWGSTQN